MTKTRIVAAAALSLVLLPIAARAQDKYTFAHKPVAGQQYDMTSSVKTDMDMVASGQPVATNTEVKRSGKVTIVAVKDGAPTELKVTFGDDCQTTTTNNGEKQNTPFALAGKTLKVKKGEDGQAEVDGADPDADTTKQLTQMMSGDTTFFPKDAVAIGDEWECDPAATRKAMGFEPNDDVSATCKLVKLSTVGDRPSYRVSVTLTGAKTQNGMNIKFDMKGTMEIDRATGLQLLGDVTGKMKIDGMVATPQGPVQIAGTGKLKMHTTNEPTGGTPDAKARTDDDENPLSAKKEKKGDDTPLAKDDPKFAGDYKGTEMSLHLDYADGVYTGTMTKGGKKFPVTCKEDGEKLAGTFTAGGKRYEFTASLNGAYMSLQSGETSYSMKKDSTNPLDH